MMHGEAAPAGKTQWGHLFKQDPIDNGHSDTGTISSISW
ncbi:hypothetical protein [Azospirillum melinis]